MNFLQIAQRLRRKCRVTGTGPLTVIGQNEEYARLVDMANEAWMSLQLIRPDWKWMRNSATFPTVAAQATYTLAQIESTGSGFSNFGNWDLDTFRCYTTSVGTNDEYPMDWITYDAWRDTYQLGATRSTTSRPTQFTITPALGVGLGVTPAAGYTISADYFKVATEMALDADIPALPTQFHMAIVYRAMMFYGVSEAKPEIYDEGQTEFDRMMARINLQQLPRIQLAGALA